MIWPAGLGLNFKGIYDLATQPHAGVRQATDRTPHRRGHRELRRSPIHGWTRRSSWRAAAYPGVRPRVLSRRPSDAGVSSARRCKNFGVRELLDALAAWAPPPRAAAGRAARRSSPTEPKVAGFVFKVQANMDPNHRDRVAFLRLCSGKFRRGMKLKQIGHRQGPVGATRRSCSSPASASWSTRPGRATSSASPTTACCASATR